MADAPQTVLDNFDREVAVGDRIVFNRSGYLETGRVTKIHKSKGRWSADPHFNYLLTVDVDGGYQTAKVRNTRGILRLPL